MHAGKYCLPMYQLSFNCYYDFGVFNPQSSWKEFCKRCWWFFYFGLLREIGSFTPSVLLYVCVVVLQRNCSGNLQWVYQQFHCWHWTTQEELQGKIIILWLFEGKYRFFLMPYYVSKRNFPYCEYEYDLCHPVLCRWLSATEFQSSAAQYFNISNRHRMWTQNRLQKTNKHQKSISNDKIAKVG